MIAKLNEKDFKIFEKWDHIAYVVRSTDESLKLFSLLYPETEIYRKYVTSQKVFITYLKSAWEGPKLELVEPNDKKHPLHHWLKEKNCVPYHLCYRVTDINTSFSLLRQKGFVVLTRPFDALEKGEKAAHLYHPDCGMIEIVGPSL